MEGETEEAWLDAARRKTQRVLRFEVAPEISLYVCCSCGVGAQLADGELVPVDADRRNGRV